MYKPRAKEKCILVAPIVVQDDNSPITWVDLVYGATKRYSLDKESTYSTTSEKLTVFCLSVPETSLTSTPEQSKYKNYQEDEIKLLNKTSVPIVKTIRPSSGYECNSNGRKLSFFNWRPSKHNILALNTANQEHLISSNAIGTDIIPLLLYQAIKW